MATGRFSGPVQRHVAHVLATRGPSSLSEIQAVVGCDKANLLHCLERLEHLDAGALVTGVSTGDLAAPGQSARLWSLTDAGRKALEPKQQDVGRLNDGMRWVLATFSTAEGIGVDDALNNGELVAGSVWVARFDGDGRGYLFAFDPAAGPQPVESLLRALKQLGARCEVGTITSVQATQAFLEVLRTALVAGSRAARAATADDG
jgi:hypothetical protein